jgi:hypothetical protein
MSGYYQNLPSYHAHVRGLIINNCSVLCNLKEIFLDFFYPAVNWFAQVHCYARAMNSTAISLFPFLILFSCEGNFEYAGCNSTVVQNKGARMLEPILPKLVGGEGRWSIFCTVMEV